MSGPSESGQGTAPVDLAEAYAAVRRRARQVWRRRILGGTATVLLLSGASLAAGVAWVRGIPTPEPVAVTETTTVYFSDGKTVMARLGEQNRTVVDLVDLPAHVPAAVVAAVDPGFWDGSGTNIARQYARFTSDDDLSGLTGQARVLVMANKLEDAHSKEQILELYLNAIYFGRRAYGIGAAAQTYFGKPATELDVAEAITLAGLIESPGDGRFDPTINPAASQRRFADIRDLLVSLGVIDGRTASELRVPRVAPDDPSATASGLERPTGLVVAHVLAELRQSDQFAGKPPGYLENGGFQIVTTVDATAQSLLEQAADETVEGSVMHGQTGNLQAAAVVIEPGSGRVLAYYGGHDGTGADYAGWHLDASGTPVGYGAHPPAQTFNVYTLAAALDAGMSVRSTWPSPPAQDFAGTGGDPGTSVRDFNRPPCQPTCTLAEAIASSLNVPFFALAQTLRPAAVVDMARAAGIDSMWRLPRESGIGRADPAARRPRTARAPMPPSVDGVGVGAYPISVLDHANGMATLAAGGVRAQAHFVRRVSKGPTVLYGESRPGRPATGARTRRRGRPDLGHVPESGLPAARWPGLRARHRGVAPRGQRGRYRSCLGGGVHTQSRHRGLARQRGVRVATAGPDRGAGGRVRAADRGVCAVHGRRTPSAPVAQCRVSVSGVRR